MRGLLWSLSALGLLGCSAGAKPPPPPLAAHAEVEAPLAPRRPYAETMPASNEAPIVPGIWVRLGAPSRTLGKLPSMVRDSPPVAPITSLDNQLASPFGSAVAAVIDLSQPVDVALDLPGVFFVDPSPTWSFRVRSPDAVLHGTAGLSLQRVSAGVWSIAVPPPAAPELEPDAAGEEEQDPEEYEGEAPEVVLEAPSCQLRHLPEPVGYRVLCSASAERLNRDALFLTAPARDTPTALDARAELGGPEYRKLTDKRQRQFEDVIEVEEDPSARAITALLSNATRSLLLHDQFGAELELRGELLRGQIEVRFGAELDAPLLNGWLAQSSTVRLPASCSRLPADGALAGCFSGLGEEIVRHLLDGVMNAMSEDLQITPRDFAEMSAALGGLVPRAGSFSFACGVDPDEAFRALTAPAVADADEAGRPLSAASVASLNAALGGWCAVAFDVDADRYLAAVQRAFRANNLKATKKRADPNPRSHSHLKQKHAPRGLPTKSLHYVGENRPDPRYRPLPYIGEPPMLPYDMHLIVVPDGARAWIVTSRSEKLAVGRARSILAAADPKQSWPELTVLDGQPALGFLAVDFAAASAIDIEWDSKQQRARARDALKTALVTSGKRKRVPFWLDVVERRDAPGHAMRLRTEFPFFAVLGDLAAASEADDHY